VEGTASWKVGRGMSGDGGDGGDGGREKKVVVMAINNERKRT
jgi:hypothetical protein